MSDTTDAIKLAIDPGAATPQVIADVLIALSDLHKAHGGEGLVFSLAGDTMTEIQPALMAQEWTTLRDMTDREREMVFSSLLSSKEQPTPAHFAYVMALANAALPDDDPHKITREDVDRIVTAAAWIVADAVGSADREFVEQVRAIAAKLAALVPPDHL